MTQSKKTGVKTLFLILSIFAAVKMLLVGFGLDEEYQVVMAYRNASGDRLFLDMWEPHQSSAFLCTLLMKPYLPLFGTTGVVLYLKVWGTLLHLGVSAYLYRVLKSMVGREYAGLLGIIYFNTIPKQMILPEFGIMQVWFYTLLSLFLIQYYRSGKKAGYLALASLALMLCVLSYPSCLVLYPFTLLWIARLSGQSRWRDMGIVTLICGLGGAGYLGMLLSYAPPKKLASILSLIVGGDATHILPIKSRLLTLSVGILYLAALLAGCFLVSFLIGKWKKFDLQKICFLTAMSACAVEVFCWMALNSGYETMQLHLPAIAALGLSPYAKNFPFLHGRWALHAEVHSSQCPPTEKALCARLLKYGMLGALLCLLAVLCLTDLPFIPSIPHAMPAAFYGMALFLLAQKNQYADKNSFPNPNFSWAYAVLAVWCLTAIVGKGYTLRGNTQYNNILQSGGILKHGPAAGTISNYMGAYIYNSDYEDWQDFLQDGDRVLIMVDQVMNLGTIQYLFKNVEISHFSIVNPTVYDERLLEYWERYPHKMPNVIIVDCWYGILMTDPDGWMMRYIENEFGYTRFDDGRYIRVYRRA